MEKASRTARGAVNKTFSFLSGKRSEIHIWARGTYPRVWARRRQQHRLYVGQLVPRGVRENSIQNVCHITSIAGRALPEQIGGYVYKEYNTITTSSTLSHVLRTFHRYAITKESKIAPGCSTFVPDTPVFFVFRAFTYRD